MRWPNRSRVHAPPEIGSQVLRRIVVISLGRVRGIRDTAVIPVSYESQVMVGRAAADPQNNPAVEGVLDRPSLAAHTRLGTWHVPD